MLSGLYLHYAPSYSVALLYFMVAVGAAIAAVLYGSAVHSDIISRLVSLGVMAVRVQ